MSVLLTILICPFFFLLNFSRSAALLFVLICFSVPSVSAATAFICTQCLLCWNFLIPRNCNDLIPPLSRYYQMPNSETKNKSSSSMQQQWRSVYNSQYPERHLSLLLQHAPLILSSLSTFSTMMNNDTHSTICFSFSLLLCVLLDSI